MKHNAGEYDKELHCTINGGTISGHTGLVVANPNPYTGSKDADITINGGKFLGINGGTGLLLDNSTGLFNIALNGGEFSKFNNLDYSYTGANGSTVYNVSISLTDYLAYLPAGYTLKDVSGTNNVSVELI